MPKVSTSTASVARSSQREADDEDCSCLLLAAEAAKKMRARNKESRGGRRRTGGTGEDDEPERREGLATGAGEEGADEGDGPGYAGRPERVEDKGGGEDAGR